MVDNYRPVSILPALSKVFKKWFSTNFISTSQNTIYYIVVSMASEKDIPLNW